MSHVATVDLHITDLESLKRACAPLGLEFREGQQTYKWYGTHVGDYPLPEGFSKEDLGRCEHAIAVVGGDSRTYEVGVVKRRDGKPGYQLLWDFWAGGHGLQSKVGDNCNTLKQSYTAEVAIKELKRMGRRVSRSVDAEGNIILRAKA